MLLLVWVTLAASPDDSATTYHGRRNQLDVRPPRIEADAAIDGSLDDAPWRRAARLTGFSQFTPIDGVPAEDSTDVLVWYSATAIYFGIRAFERHGAVRATLAERDKIQGDDYVEILLDTFNDHRQSVVFGVNPLGVQFDGTINEGVQQTRGAIGTGTSVRQEVDPSADFVYQSTGRVTDSGFEIEVRIPFKSLRFTAQQRQSWGLNVVRYVQHSGHQDSWAPARRAAASFLAQSGRLSELVDLRRGLVLDLNPELTSAARGDSLNGRPYRYRAETPRVGGNVRWGVTNNLTLNGTIKPDFSQVEADVAQISYDPRNALFYPEKRPFFLDGIEQFETPNRLIYTRRIVQPVAAAKVAGKVSGTTIGALSAVDARSGSRTGTNHPVYNILRVRRDVASQSTLGLTYTDRIDGSDYNRVVGADARLVFHRIYSVRAHTAASVTRVRGVTARAPLLDINLQRTGRTFGMRYAVTAVHPDFRAASGFISRTDIATLALEHRLTWFGRPRSLVEGWTGSVVPNHTFTYDNFVRARHPNDRKLHFNSTFTLRGGWRVRSSLFVESFLFDAAYYARQGYALERTTAAGTDTIPFVGTHRLPNLDLLLDVQTPQWSRFAAGTNVIVGKDENFFEWSSANILFISANLTWRPTEKVRVEGLYSHQEFRRRTDGSIVGLRRVPRLKLEYQLARPMFVRVVGQYDSDFTDDLRDDSRTGYPILRWDDSGTRLVRAARQERNDFRMDWLFAYTPGPGTVLFAGYGSTLTEFDAFSFRGLRRQSDGVFVKLSYLFRL